MSKALRELQGSSGEISPSVRPTELIIDDEYFGKVAIFLKDAKSEIRICAYAWRWYLGEPELAIQKFNTTVFGLNLKHIRVRILVDNNSMCETFKKLGFNVRSVDPARMLHTKAICIDEKTLVIGSHNLTKRAGKDNYEMSIATQDPEPVLQFIEYFDSLWGSRA